MSANTQSEDGASRTKKKKRGNEATMKEDLHQFSTVAQSANKMLTQLVNKQKAVPMEDKDWDFCKPVYNKMKEIPEGYVKDELQLEIQHLIIKARKQNMNPPIPPIPTFNMSAGYYNGNYDNNAVSQHFYQPMSSQASGSIVTAVCYGSSQELMQSSCNPYTQL